MWRLAVGAVAIAACGPSEAAGPVVLRGGRLPDGRVADVVVDGGRIASIGGAAPADAQVVDVDGRFLVPGFIDSHVHLAYLPEVSGMLDGGVVAAVDLAAPLSFFGTDTSDLRVVRAGPMITAVSGYPTQSWGSNGYGLEVANAAEGVAAVDQLAGLGAGVIKVPITSPPTLDEVTLRAVVDAAHAKGLKVAVHALGDDEAKLGAAVGCDVLAHVPVEPMSEATLDAWAGRAVIPTIDAFGGGGPAVDNVRKLRERGVIVLYGTDFGNSQTAGIQPREIERMTAAGMDGAAIVAAGTTAPAAYWGLEGYGTLAVGGEGSLLVLDSDPAVDPTALTRPVQVWVRGKQR